MCLRLCRRLPVRYLLLRFPPPPPLLGRRLGPGGSIPIANPGYNFPRTPKTPKTPLTRLARIMSFPTEEEEADDDSRSNGGTASAGMLLVAVYKLCVVRDPQRSTGPLEEWVL